MTQPPSVEVNLLTGFLGSGKTTLLRRMLKEPALADTAVLINEFGEVGLDHHLIDKVDDTTVLLESGCVCCTIRGELSGAMRELYSKRDRGVIPLFKRLVIESTGLADPFPILSTVRNDPVLSHHFICASVVATVDAVNMEEQKRWAEFSRQVASADTIVLTKGDLVTDQVRASCKAALRLLNPEAKAVDICDTGWSASDILGGHEISTPRGKIFDDVSSSKASLDRNGHHTHPEAFAITIEDPLDWTGFGIWLSMLLNAHGARILRVKAILNLQGEDRPVAVHGVQHLVHPPHHMEAWPDEDRRSRLVFIVDGLDCDLIRRSFNVFLGTSQ